MGISLGATSLTSLSLESVLLLPIYLSTLTAVEPLQVFLTQIKKWNCELIVLPEPRIESITLSAPNVVRKTGTSYHLDIKGTKLDAMDGLQIELYNRDPLSSKYWPISKDVSYQRDKISATIGFQKTSDFFDIGEYQVRLKRQVLNTSLVKIYPSDTYFKVVYPQEMSDDQTSLVTLKDSKPASPKINSNFRGRSGDDKCNL